MAPTPVDTSIIIFYIWPPQSRLSSVITTRDLAGATRVTRKSLIENVGETVTVLSLCLNAINMNSVLVIFRVKGVVPKETVVPRRWGSSTQKFGFINGVDNVN